MFESGAVAVLCKLSVVGIMRGGREGGEPPYSVIMESRTREDTIMFESGAVAVLCKFSVHIVPKSSMDDLHPYCFKIEGFAYPC